ncbi:MAG: hypothetical protein ACI9UJ_000672 [bacterium]|jgi:hypothetical protein
MQLVKTIWNICYRKLENFLLNNKVNLISKKYKTGHNLFIDCGSNIGQGFSYFNQYFDKKIMILF